MLGPIGIQITPAIGDFHQLASNAAHRLDGYSYGTMRIPAEPLIWGRFIVVDDSAAIVVPQLTWINAQFH